MASNIVPGNIDGEYPVAGIDNDSQGFRTNFTNISTNFTSAKEEIEDLQAKSVLKAPLTGESTVDNDMLGAVLKSPTLLDSRETVFAHSTVSGNVDIDHQNGHYQTLTTSGTITLVFSNFPGTSGTPVFGRVRIEIKIMDIAHTVTLPTGVFGTELIEGFASDIITFASTGTYTFDITNYDGSTFTIHDMTRSPIPAYTPLTINAQTGTTYVPVLTDGGAMITMTNAVANTVNIPDNLSVAFEIGTEIHFIQNGAGTTTIAVPGSDTISSRGSLFNLNGTSARAVAFKITATSWVLSGDLV